MMSTPPACAQTGRHYTDRTPDPPEPGLCCGTGCQHCVWLEYADRLFEYHLSDIVERSVRSFLLMELAQRYEEAQRLVKEVE
ncbi:unnamed protein product [Echinostoma caproni]|uniref:Oxidoreductase-like domain-containing protein n=1 Tax=Echinostoma caproni TaxID=27848 RepID=A0A183B073_9TREM|nr:unnamed protein product [Echinostoma caproni]